LVNKVTDYWGNATTYSYDNFGNVSAVAQSGGIGITSNTLAWVTSPTNARYSATQTKTDGSQTVAYYDVLGREIRKGAKLFDGSMSNIQTDYNAKGQAYRVSEPFTSSPSLWNTTTFDNYGRVLTFTPSVGASSSYTYSGGVTTVTSNGRTYTTTTTNATGWAASKSDPGGTISYLYKPDGNVKQITAPGSVVTQMTYDAQGNQLTLVDPSAGTTTYTYCGAGELKTQVTPLGTTTNYYLTDGRINYYTNPSGTYSFAYGTNKLVSAVTSPGSVTRSYTYYSNGKVDEISETIEAGQTNKVKFVYDSYGRVSSKIYTNSNNITQTESYVYNGYGYLDQVKFNNVVVYDVSTMDTRGNITAATIGGTAASWSYNTYGQLIANSGYYTMGFSYTPSATTGNIDSRTNTQRGLTENFYYDNLDRLDYVTKSGVTTLDLGYDTKGNITTKTDAGTLVYDLAGKPYAVGHVTPYTANFPATPQSITYTAFGKVNTITEGVNNVSFKYNADNERIKMVTQLSGVTTKTKYYFGSSYEKEVAGATTTEYIWIGGSPYTAVAVAKIVNGGAPVVWSIFRDNLGSITHVKNGTTIQEFSFDAYGRRRDKDDWSYTLSGEPTLFADRGYTGHEHLTQFGLINMNGRLYDPVVGRFLSPDNYVQSPDFTQSYNRYGYCMNNPLSYTDPSGDFLIPLFLLFTDVGYDIQKFLSPVAIHFEIPFGSENKHIGYDISFGVPQISPVSYRQHSGKYYYWRDYDNSYSGWETRSGSEWSMFSSGFSYSCTFYDRQIDRFDQYRDVARLGIPWVNIQVENDASGHSIFKFPLMPDHTSSDKFLTGQVKMRFGMAEIGLTLFTGDPGPNRASRIKDEDGNYTIGINGEDPDEFRAGILYIGFGPIKLGINSEGIRDNTQNWLHRNVTNDPTFKKLPRRPRFFWEIF
jgi:RHS repeat-associated protein